MGTYGRINFKYIRRTDVLQLHLIIMRFSNLRESCSASGFCRLLNPLPATLRNNYMYMLIFWLL